MSELLLFTIAVGLLAASAAIESFLCTQGIADSALSRRHSCFVTGLLVSGYHLTDDHDIIRINRDIQNTGFINTVYSWLQSDLHIRFRPVYWIAKEAETFFVGTDWFLWHLFKALGAGTCVYLL